MRLKLLLLAAGVMILSAPASANAETAKPSGAAEMAKNSTAIYATYQKQAKACRWGTATLDSAVFAEQYMWGKLAKVEDPNFAAVRTEFPAEQPCGSAADLQVNGQTGLIYWRWLTRSLIMYQLTTTPGWGQGLITFDRNVIATMEPVRKQYENGIIAAEGAAAVQAETAALQKEAVLVLNLMCEPRKTRNVSQPRACPTIPANLVSDRPAAIERGEQLEVFNMGLVGAIAAEQRGEYGTPYQYRETLDFFGNINTDYINSTGCNPEIYTIFPAANDTIVTGEILDVSVHKIGTAGTFGRIKVKRDEYGSYDILDGSALNIFSDALGPEFGVCF